MRSIDELPTFPDRFLLWCALREFDPDASHARGVEQWAGVLEQLAVRIRDEVFNRAAMRGLEFEDAQRLVERPRKERAAPRADDALTDVATELAYRSMGPVEPPIERGARRGDPLAALLVDVGRAFSDRPAEFAFKDPAAMAKTIWSDLCRDVELSSEGWLPLLAVDRATMDRVRERLWELGLELQRVAWRLARPRTRGRPKGEKTSALCAQAASAGLSCTTLAREAVRVRGRYVDGLLRLREPTPDEWTSATSPGDRALLEQRARDARQAVVEQLGDRFRHHWPAGK